jgi:integrase
MASKRAKVLIQTHVEDLLFFADDTRYLFRNTMIVLLSVKAGLLATVRMNGYHLTVSFHGNTVMQTGLATGPVIQSAGGGFMKPIAIVTWFAQTYHAIKLEECFLHSRRRTFITRAAARLVHRAGSSLWDAQVLAGHRSLLTKQRYSDAQRELMALI